MIAELQGKANGLQFAQIKIDELQRNANNLKSPNVGREMNEE